MMSGTKSLIAALLVFLLLAPAITLAANDIRFNSIAEVEVKQVNAKGEKVTVRQPAALVEPGEIAIYTNSFTNVGKQPAANVVIDNPIPKNTQYLLGSATETGFDLLFSVDGGKSFGKPDTLTVLDAQGRKVPAGDRDYTNIRWTMLTPLKPGATGVVEFRVRVK